MKKLGFVFYSMVIVIAFQSCNSANKSKEIEQYQSPETKNQLNETLQKKVGDWIKEGVDCYGVIMLISKEGDVRAVKELKAKVLIIEDDKIKMKALENVSLTPKPDCFKIGIAKGGTWWEEEGDLFQTREKALEYIKTIKIVKKSYAGTKITVD